MQPSAVKMLSAFKFAAFLWLLLLIAPSVISRSFVTKKVNERDVWKRDVDAVETKSQKADISSFTVTSNIQYRYAVTTVSSQVANPANASKEISFQVTLPESAFVSKFLMVIKDKAYEAYVKGKEEAKKDYQDAVDSGHTAGLVSLNTRDSNIFTVSVNVEALGHVTFNLTYEQVLTRTLGQYENIINVNPGQIVKSFKVAVNILESSRITSVQVSDLKTSNEIDSTNSKSIDKKIERPTDKTAEIVWSPDTKTQEELSIEGVNGQFIVCYDVDHSANPNQILVDEGYFVHFYAPTNLKTLPKHVLFVLDISGSMMGRKIEQLREALTLILRDIGENDFFSILPFSTSVEQWTLDGVVGDASSDLDSPKRIETPGPEINRRFIIPASSGNIKKATEFAQTLQDSSSTNIIGALRKALEIATWGQKQHNIKAKPLIIFLTDGEPNVDLSNPEEIVKEVQKLNTDKYPIFSLALGEGADYKFLRKLSLSNAGFARNIYVASDTSLQLKNFYQEVASPLLSNVTFEYIPGQLAEGLVTKTIFNNLYNGSELVVAGKLSNRKNEIGGNLTYEDADGFYCVPIPLPLDVSLQKSTGHLEKLWAYLYIKELLDKDLISDEKNSTFKQKALKLSLEYGFVTPLTSLVVVKPNDTTSGASIQNSNPLTQEKSSFISTPASFLSAMAAPVHAYSMHYSIPSPGLISNRMAFDADDADDTIEFKSLITVHHDILPTEEPVDAHVIDFSEPYNLSNIAWLKNKTEIKYPTSNNSYTVFTGDLPNVEYQSCLIPNSNNTLGRCRHLAQCIIPEILSSFDVFVSYGEHCVIDARFVGICCPRKLIGQNSNSANGKVTDPVPTLAPLLQPTI